MFVLKNFCISLSNEREHNLPSTSAIFGSVSNYGFFKILAHNIICIYIWFVLKIILKMWENKYDSYGLCKDFSPFYALSNPIRRFRVKCGVAFVNNRYHKRQLLFCHYYFCIPFMNYLTFLYREVSYKSEN